MERTIVKIVNQNEKRSFVHMYSFCCLNTFAKESSSPPISRSESGPGECPGESTPTPSSSPPWWWWWWWDPMGEGGEPAPSNLLSSCNPIMFEMRKGLDFAEVRLHKSWAVVEGGDWSPPLDLERAARLLMPLLTSLSLTMLTGGGPTTEAL